MADAKDILQEIELELAAEGYLKQKAQNRRREKEKAQEPARYLSQDGLTILVGGRNNRQNDLLTFKLSSPRHLWLHARQLPGSHVIVLAEGSIPPETLQQAACLAAYFPGGGAIQAASRWIIPSGAMCANREAPNRALSATSRHKQSLSIPTSANCPPTSINNKKQASPPCGHLHLPLVSLKIKVT